MMILHPSRACESWPCRDAGVVAARGGRERWVAILWTCSLGLALPAGCGTEAPLASTGEGHDDAGVSEVSASASSEVTTSDSAETSQEEVSYVVSNAEEEVTQVYNGETHLIGDAPARLRAESDEVAVYVEQELADSVSDDQLNGFVRRLVAAGSPESHLPNAGILRTNESVFGALQTNNLPDGKQRVFIVDTAGAGDGYLCSWCTYPDLHLDGHLVSPLDGEHALSISAHELFHAIHRGYDTDEEVWVDESLAEAAMTVNGYFTDQAWLSDYLENANQDWGPSGADVTSVHYGACLAWGTYLWEQGGPELMQAITRETDNGWAGLEAALQQVGETRTAWELFLELGAALYFDDAERGFGIRSFDFPRPLRVSVLDGETSATVEPYGFLHYEVNGNTRLTVKGDGVTAGFVADSADLSLQSVPVGVGFDVTASGVLFVTARSSTDVTISVQ